MHVTLSIALLPVIFMPFSKQRNTSKAKHLIVSNPSSMKKQGK